VRPVKIPAPQSPLRRRARLSTFGPQLTDKQMSRVDAFRMVRRRAAAIGMDVKIGCHTFRATGFTAYLENGGSLEKAQLMAAHKSPRTTKLYDRTGVMRSHLRRLNGLRSNYHTATSSIGPPVGLEAPKRL
jgi:integrase